MLFVVAVQTVLATSILACTYMYTVSVYYMLQLMHTRYLFLIVGSLSSLSLTTFLTRLNLMP